MDISVIGLGYVGLSNALLLAQHENVLAYDIDLKKIKQLKDKKSPIVDVEIEEFLGNDALNLVFTDDFEATVNFGKYIIIATPTNYDEETGKFDTSSIESVISQALEVQPEAVFIIKSTIPVHYVARLKETFGTDNIIFVPEFLREGRALYDNLYPSRIIVGEDSQRGREISELFQRGAKKENVPTLLMSEDEAEAVKLFSNSYLALRVAYFNEVDTFAESHGLAVGKIIAGMSFDSRIGNYYNNPSFGYGGYCLPKDTKQLKSEFYAVPEKMMTAIVESNATRKSYIAEQILSRQPKKVGIYKLAMKQNSDNFRQAAIFDIIDMLRQAGTEVLLYDPTIKENEFHGMTVVQDFETFGNSVDVIVANRVDDQVKRFESKIYTRDLYTRD